MLRFGERKREIQLAAKARARARADLLSLLAESSARIAALHIAAKRPPLRHMLDASARAS